MMKGRPPRIFVGSASESLDVAESLQDILSRGANAPQVTLWSAMDLRAGNGILEELLGRLDYYDFGIFVLTGDDAAIIREKSTSIPRDNVLLELGMFMGRKGKNRAFFILPKDSNLHIPTDLAGIVHVAQFDLQRFRSATHDPTASLSVVATQIRQNLPEYIDEIAAPMRLLRADTEIPGEFLHRVAEVDQTIHEAVLCWTIPHAQTARDEYRNVRDDALSRGIELRQIVLLHHSQHFDEVLGMMARFESNPRYALRFVTPSTPPLPTFNYWSFDLRHFYFEPSNFDRGRVQAVLALHVPDDQRVREGCHAYFDDLWRHTSGNQLVAGGEADWERIRTLGTQLRVRPLSLDDIDSKIAEYRAPEFADAKWVNARLTIG
jgi:hypothetical protein